MTSLEEDFNESAVAVASMQGEPEPSIFEDPFAITGEYWVSVLAAAIVGALAGLLDLAYLTAIDEIPRFWYSTLTTTLTLGNGTFINNTVVAFPNSPKLLTYGAGQPWWIAIGTACGLFTGVWKAVFGKDEFPSFMNDLKRAEVDVWDAVQMLVLCVVAMISAAPMGPEAGLGPPGMVLGQVVAWTVQRFSPHSALQISANEMALVGAAGVFAPLLPSPLIALFLVSELGNQRGSRLYSLLFVGSTVSFAVYSSIRPKTYLSPVGDLFIGLTQSPLEYDFVFGILLGLMGIFLALAFFLIAGIVKVIMSRFLTIHRLSPRIRVFLSCTIAGTLFGVLNFAFPLSLGSGNILVVPITIFGPNQLSSGLMAASIFVKMLSYWISSHGGIVGGIMFPTLVMGQLAGACVAQWTGLRFSLAISASFCVIAAAFIRAPSFLIILAYLVFFDSESGLFPIFTAVLTAYYFIGIGIPQRLTRKSIKKDSVSSSCSMFGR